jgi:hypothetical protein
MTNIREGLPNLNAVDAEFITVTGEEKHPKLLSKLGSV